MADRAHATSMTSNGQTLVDANIEHDARERLLAARAYAFCFERIVIHYADGILTLRGQLPSYYLKQVLQTVLAGMQGVAQIHNRVEVKRPG
jgi:osmotically-inducible protein OsmY